MPQIATQKRILVVDDETAVRDALGRVLHLENYAVLTAADGLEATQKITEIQVDLVILDVNMPFQSGWETARHLRKAYPLLPVVMITAHPAEVSDPQATEVDLVMTKPLDLPLFLRAIQKLIAEQRANACALQGQDIVTAEEPNTQGTTCVVGN